MMEKGWKTTNPEKRGDVLILLFQNQITNEVLFKYAPKWEDIPIIVKMINMLCDIETYKILKKTEGIKK